MGSDTFTRPALARIAGRLGDQDLAQAPRPGGDLIGLIIEATGLQAEIGEVCLVGDGRDRAPVSTEVVGFRGGRTLLMPLG
jgi:flagellum-specific ATP synthase